MFQTRFLVIGLEEGRDWFQVGSSASGNPFEASDEALIPVCEYTLI